MLTSPGESLHNIGSHNLKQNELHFPLQPDDAGIIRSRVFPGLWLAENELLAGNMKQVLQVLQMGLDSEEHQTFVEQLAQR